MRAQLLIVLVPLSLYGCGGNPKKKETGEAETNLKGSKTTTDAERLEEQLTEPGQEENLVLHNANMKKQQQEKAEIDANKVNADSHNAVSKKAAEKLADEVREKELKDLAAKKERDHKDDAKKRKAIDENYASSIDAAQNAFVYGRTKAIEEFTAAMLKLKEKGKAELDVLAASYQSAKKEVSARKDLVNDKKKMEQAHEDELKKFQADEKKAKEDMAKKEQEMNTAHDLALKTLGGVKNAAIAAAGTEKHLSAKALASQIGQIQVDELQVSATPQKGAFAGFRRDTLAAPAKLLDAEARPAM